MIYFDQAASSFPKPPQVSLAMAKAVDEIGANPGRGGHTLARKAADVIVKTREKAALLFGLSDPKMALFYPNATFALNQAIKGLPWNANDHIISTSFEHNSVRRPLEFLKRTYGVHVSFLQWTGNNDSYIASIEKEIKAETKLIAMSHGSNVTGSIIPIDEIMQLAKKHELVTLIDASQTAGHMPINMKKQGIDMLAFSGHKGLMGPQGTGMLLIEGNINLEPLHHGGTGTYSDSPEQPDQWPEKMESGTLNTPGIAGLYEAFLAYEKRMNENVPRETILATELARKLKAIPDIVCYTPDSEKLALPIVAFNLKDVDSQEIATILDSHYDIAVRAGLHCSPLTHEMLYTTKQGVIRASLGFYNTEEEVDTFVQAIEEIVSAYKHM